MKPNKSQVMRYACAIFAGVICAAVLITVPNPVRSFFTDQGTTAENVSIARKPLADFKDLVDSNTLVFIGRIKATNAKSFERVPSTAEEGVMPGEGANVYGTITFSVDEMLKGSQATEVSMAFESGKRDPVPGDPDRLLSYTYDNLKELQNDNGSLKSPKDLKKTYVVFASPNNGYYPAAAGAFVLDPVGIAVLRDNTLRFEGKPFGRGNQQPTINELRQLVAK